jgi:hypothetical protein
MKKEIEYKTWVKDPKRILKILAQESVIGRYKVTQKIYKNDNISYFARVATFVSKAKKEAFLTIKNDLIKTGEGLKEGQIVSQEELESEIPFNKTGFYNEVLIKLGLKMVQKRDFIKHKSEFRQTIVSIDDVQGKYHLEIEAASQNKINKVIKVLGL